MKRDWTETKRTVPDSRILYSSLSIVLHCPCAIAVHAFDRLSYSSKADRCQRADSKQMDERVTSEDVQRECGVLECV